MERLLSGVTTSLVERLRGISELTSTLLKRLLLVGRLLSSASERAAACTLLERYRVTRWPGARNLGLLGNNVGLSGSGAWSGLGMGIARARVRGALV